IVDALWRDEQFLEVKLLPGELGCILDRRADQSPPHFKSGLALCVARRLELGIPKKDGVEPARISARRFSVHPIGSGCLNARFSGSARSTSRRTVRLRDARSPRGPILLPENKWMDEAAVQTISLTPSLRSE